MKFSFYRYPFSPSFFLGMWTVSGMSIPAGNRHWLWVFGFLKGSGEPDSQPFAAANPNPLRFEIAGVFPVSNRASDPVQLTSIE
jgi:hypothetical protein